ncbi:glycosyltransferase family 2 protein [Bifidobacterium aquikefiri]|uniref:glycosyltransferase family 2 protein n=1 Tax=Bifidobacterium aquikefiri TaxID=1653207 RepID=UPI0023F5651E|nr:glycosyltransferase family 2 protein [Bifidobacterium aquikefiri]
MVAVNNSSLISIIIPIYNSEKFINRCLNSVTKQTHKNLEIILVDDGSPDNSPEICDEWAQKDKRIMVIHKTNGGQASARNMGLDKCTGDLIGFVDHDDWISNDMYESMLNNLIEADADIAYTAAAHAYENGNISTKHIIPDTHLVLTSGEGFKYVNLPGYFGFAPWDKLIKREIIQNLRFPESIPRGDDYGFTFETLDRANIIVYDSSPKYFYMQSRESLSNTPSSIGTLAATETKKMVELVRQKYPEQLPFALYGHLETMLGIYNQAIASDMQNQIGWKRFAKEIQQYANVQLPAIEKKVSVPRIRKMQIKLLQNSLTLYAMFYRAYKISHPYRMS